MACWETQENGPLTITDYKELGLQAQARGGVKWNTHYCLSQCQTFRRSAGERHCPGGKSAPVCFFKQAKEPIVINRPKK
jgi:hypothetical protein